MDQSKFNSVWQESIKPKLADADTEAERKRARRQRVAGIVAFIAVGGTFFITAISGDISLSNIETWTIILWAVGLLIAAIAAVFYSHNSNDFAARFKQAVINGLSGNLTDLVWSINDNSAREALTEVVEIPQDQSKNWSSVIVPGGNSVLSEQFLRSSGLYDDFDNCGGRDTLYSQNGNADVVAHRMYAAKTVGSELINIFTGFLIRIDVDRSFQGETYVQTEEDGEFMGKNIRPVGADSEAEETELEWGEFERFLLVKSTDPQEAREIFTPDFMGLLYDWWQDHDEPMRISFKGSAVYMAYPTNNKLKPHVFGSLDQEKKAVKSVLELLLFIESCVAIITDNQNC